MRGIEFKINIGYSNVFRTLFKNINISEYSLQISEEEIFTKTSLQNTSKMGILDYMNSNFPYYVFFIKLHAYPKEEKVQNIQTYEDFLKSKCQFTVLVSDGWCFEIYAKDDMLLLQFIQNAIKLKATDIHIKTDYDDCRTEMNVL